MAEYLDLIRSTGAMLMLILCLVLTIHLVFCALSPRVSLDSTKRSAFLWLVSVCTLYLLLTLGTGCSRVIQPRCLLCLERSPSPSEPIASNSNHA